MMKSRGPNLGEGSADGSYKAPAAKNTMTRGTVSRKDSTGVTDGLSERMDFDSNEHGPMYNNDRSPLTGNSQERPKPYTDMKSTPSSAKEKGNNFDIC